MATNVGAYGSAAAGYDAYSATNSNSQQKPVRDDAKLSGDKTVDRFERTSKDKLPQDKSPIDKTIEKLFDRYDPTKTSSVIDYRKDLNIYVVKVIDDQTGDQIRQSPPEHILKAREQIMAMIPNRKI